VEHTFTPTYLCMTQYGVPQPVCRHKVTGVQRIFIKTLHSHVIVRRSNILLFVIRNRKTHTHTGLPSTVVFSTCYMSVSCAFILIGQGLICRYVFMDTCRFVPPFREAKFCGVPSYDFNKLGCVAGETRLRNTGVVLR
jgi:hypothetical protein